MSIKEIANAQIESTMLGFEGHGIFTASIRLRWGSFGCAFGGYSLGSDKPGKNASGYGSAFIQQVLKTVGVEKWEDLKGRYVRVETYGMGGGIGRIGHIVEDKWFCPKTLAEEFMKFEESR